MKNLLLSYVLYIQVLCLGLLTYYPKCLSKSFTKQSIQLNKNITSLASSVTKVRNTNTKKMRNTNTKKVRTKFIMNKSQLINTKYLNSEQLVSYKAQGFLMPVAIGTGMSWMIYYPYGEVTFHKLNYELMSYFYYAVYQNFYLRSGLRLIYNDDQPDMSEKLQIQEKNLFVLSELGFIYDWYVIPSLSLGFGINHCMIKLKSGYPIIDSDDKISSSETRTVFVVQLGLGIPLLSGIFVVEPFYRNLYVLSDKIVSYGIEVTFQY